MTEYEWEQGDAVTAKLDLPPLTQQPMQHVDGTPDVAYPLRILQAYRANCDVCWVVEGLDEATAGIYDMMNRHQRERAALLDDAIRALRLHAANESEAKRG